MPTPTTPTSARKSSQIRPIGPAFAEQVVGLKGTKAELHMSEAELHEAILCGNELLLDATGALRICPAADLDRLPHPWLMAWCFRYGHWLLPTTELVSWLRDEIGGRSAIEIAAGCGALGRALGIHRTDARLHESNAQVQDLYARVGHGPPRIPPDVETLEALAAVRAYRPQVVVCAWGTEFSPSRKLSGSGLGIDEKAIVQKVETYIHIGASSTHKHRTLPRPARVLRPPWLKSRALRPEDNCIWIWGRGPKTKEED